MTDTCTWSPTQLQRLKEFNVDNDILTTDYPSNKERDSFFQALEKKLAREERDRLTESIQNGGKTKLELLTEKISSLLTDDGFSRVSTPTIISAHALAKMTIDANHPLYKQVFWLDKKRCLRPMLAPNLYNLMHSFCRLKHRPVRFFEIGSCFRKESDGSKHTSEFTMLNLVEVGLPKEERLDRLKQLAKSVAETAGLNDAVFIEEKSEVYGTTLDLVAGPDEIEVASGAMGPHPLDNNWAIRESWIGMGFGLERMLMIGAGDRSISKWCKNLHYHNGILLRI